VTASFEVIGIASGETTVIVEVPDLGASVEVPVTVRGEQRDLELNWRPDHINLGTDQGRRVILALSQPATEPLEEGDDGNNEKDGEEGDDNSGSGDDESDGDEGDDNSGSGG